MTNEALRATGQVDREAEDNLADIVSNNEQVLGTGRRGKVTEAILPSSGIRIALKKMPASPTLDEWVIERIRPIYDVEHPNVVRVLSLQYHRPSQSVLMAMEFMGSRSLKDLLLKAGRIPEAVVSVCCEHLLAGLEYLHEQRRQCHRGISPSKVLVSEQGTFKLSLSSDDIPSAAFDVDDFDPFETFAYVSPEKVAGLGWGTNTDIWSFGIVIFECLTGTYPYHPDEGAEMGIEDIIDRMVDGDPPCLPLTHSSPQAAEFVARCLVKDRMERPSSTDLRAHPFVSPLAPGPGPGDSDAEAEARSLAPLRWLSGMASA